VELQRGASVRPSPGSHQRDEARLESAGHDASLINRFFRRPESQPPLPARPLPLLEVPETGPSELGIKN